MQSRSRGAGKPIRFPVLRSTIAIDSYEDSELAAIALLCLVFAWPADDPQAPQPPQPRIISE